MIDPTPLDDAGLDRLLGQLDTPPLAAGFADRVLAEAEREDRPVAVPPLPPPARSGRRPWTRRSMWAGVIAINLIVASAIAATLSGVAPRLAPHFIHVVAVAAQALHLHRSELPRPHPVSHPAPRPMPLPPPRIPARPVAPLVAPVRSAPVQRAPRVVAHPPWHPTWRAPARMRPRGMIGRRQELPHHGLARRPAAPRSRPAPAAFAVARPQPTIDRPASLGRAPAMARPTWDGMQRRPWASAGPAQRRPGMRQWQGQGPKAWRRFGRGGRGGRGMGWRRPFGGPRRR